MTDDGPRYATLSWTGGYRFDATAKGGKISVDGDSVTAPSPVTLLAIAAAACAGADVVGILEKKRFKLTRCDAEIGGRRPAEYPKPFLEIWLRFTVAGDGLTEAAVRQAVDLSVEKYCSVLLSLNPGIPIKTEVVIG